MTIGPAATPFRRGFLYPALIDWGLASACPPMFTFNAYVGGVSHQLLLARNSSDGSWLVMFPPWVHCYVLYSDLADFYTDLRESEEWPAVGSSLGDSISFLVAASAVPWSRDEFVEAEDRKWCGQEGLPGMIAAEG